MGTLTVRNLEDDVIESVKEEARRNSRSLEAEVREILRRHKELRRRPTTEELLAVVDRIAAMTPDVPQTDSVELLRQTREER